MDQQYLDCNNLPVISPFLKQMCIKLYNEKWVRPQGNRLNTQYRHTNLPSSEIDVIPFEPNILPAIPTIVELCNDVMPSIVDPIIIEPMLDVRKFTSSHASVMESNDHLFTATAMEVSFFLL